MPALELDEFKYDLPESRIAKFPLDKRDESKLLHYNKGELSHYQFRDINRLLPGKSLLVFNETKVIPARLSFFKETGAVIEVMLLNPLKPSRDVNISMSSNESVTWQCMVKNLKKWKPTQTLVRDLTISDEIIKLEARLIDRDNNHVEISWKDPGLTFADILEYSGKVPLPPYLKREPVAIDKPRYQTVYSRNKGAVAAPTAGLHFTDKIIREIKETDHDTDYLTLHVGAGTFQPIKEKDIRKHDMHRETILVSISNLEKIKKNLGNIVAVGTTSMRTLESIYWYGVKLLSGEDISFFIEKLYPYDMPDNKLPSVNESLNAIIDHMTKMNIEQIQGETQIFILPGYKFRICQGLITNFHMPGSTLMLLVAAFVGDDWKRIYDEALSNDYRFLSYGDSSFLIPENQ
jgi:S-adenosylmethionine:tRNA ribosyltransferase-isomerase